MLIFEKAQVTKHYVQFAFLFVHTVYMRVMANGGRSKLYKFKMISDL